MKLLLDQQKTCCVCKKTSIQIRYGLPSFGHPGLDARSAERSSYAVELWPDECPHCGYVAFDIELDYELAVTRDWLKNSSYISCDNRGFENKLSKRFYRYYLICSANDWHKEAFYAVLHAAWTCDDIQDLDNAIYCRLKALEELDKLVVNGKEKEMFLLVRADLLRRTGQFDLLIKEYGRKIFSLELSNAVVAFQLKKAKEKDTACYTLADVDRSFYLYNLLSLG